MNPNQVAAEKFWLRQFSGTFSCIDLAQRRMAGEGKKNVFSCPIPAPTIEQISKLTNGADMGMFVYFLATLDVLLHRYSTEKEWLVATGAFNLKNSAQNNPLFLRCTINDQTFRELLNEQKEVVISAYKQQDYDFGTLLEKIKINYQLAEDNLTGIVFTFDKLHKSESVFECQLEFRLISEQNTWTLQTKYGNAYTTDFVQSFTALFVKLLGQLISRLDEKLSNISLLTAGEELEIISQYQYTDQQEVFPSSITQSFFENAKTYPDRVALNYRNTTTNYAALAEKVEAFSSVLVNAYKIKPADVVAVSYPSTPELVITTLAVMNIGAIVVPVDTATPAERISYLIANSGAQLFVCDRAIALNVPVCRYNSADVLIKTDYTRPALHNGQVGYMIYTSGSTGNPKGVQLTHKNLLNQFLWLRDYFTLNESDVLPQKASINFIDSLTELFYPLTYGKTAVYLMPDPDLNKNTTALLSWLKEIKTTILLFVPSVYEFFISDVNIEELTTLKHLVLGGEELKRPYQYPFNTYNLYGNSECSSISTIYKIPAGFDRLRVPIGTPIYNTYIYVLDEHLKVVPPYMQGEIYIGGAGVSEGYVNNPEFTAEKFIADPFKPSQSLYKTGDLGRITAEGNIEYIGRSDSQVKIRGMRMELGEVENTLLLHPDVADVAVLLKSDENDEKFLVAFYVLKKQLSEGDLRHFLAGRLPDYMIPSRFVQLESMPFTLSGKIDRQKLNKMALPSGEEAYEGAANTVEEQMTTIWKEILKKDKIGVNDNFFEIGGHSLKATQVLYKVHQQFNVKLNLKALFKYPTIRELSDLVAKSAKTAFHAIPTLPEAEHYPVSNAQQRLWILSQFEEGSVAYNMPGAYFLEGPLNIGVFEKVFETIIQRHESLRTSIVQVNGDPRQKIKSTEEFAYKMKITDMRTLKDNEEVARQIAIDDAATPFDMAAGPLHRSHLLMLDEEKFMFLFTIHHIISDAWSMNVMVNEVFTLYKAFLNHEANPLPDLKIHYKDYTNWIEKRTEEPDFLHHKEYWRKKLEGRLPKINLPVDVKRPPIQTFRGDMFEVIVPKNELNELYSFVNENESTLFITLLTACELLLYQITGQADIIVGSSVAGREHPDLDNQIGFYVNTLALRVQMNEQGTFRELHEQVKTITLEAQEHQAYPFDKLVRELLTERDPGRSPIFDVMVELNNVGMDAKNVPTLEGVELRNVKNYEVTSKFDLTLNFMEVDDGLRTFIEYNSDLFRRETIEGILLKLIHIIKNLQEIKDKQLHSFAPTKYVTPEQVQVKQVVPALPQESF